MTGTAIDPRFATRARQPGLDLLRAGAIVIVVVYHAGIFGFALPFSVHRFGWVGVDLFFVLSGYLIGGQLIEPLARGEDIRLGRFFSRRALRIMPAYFFILAIYFCLPGLREFPDISPLWKYLISVQNINLRGGTAFSHAWSLAIEDQFYLALPLLLILMRRWKGAGIAIPCGVFLGGVALRTFLAYQNPGDGGVSFRGFQRWIYYPTWTRLDPLVFGVVLAAMEKLRPCWWRRLTSCASWLWLPGLGAVAAGLYLGDGDVLTVVACAWQFPLIALGMAALLVCAVDLRRPLRWPEIPGTAFLASIAYSVYLSHKLVIHAVIQFCSSHDIALKSWPALLLVEASIYLAGMVLFLGVERPFLLLRQRLTKVETRPIEAGWKARRGSA